MLQKIDNFLHNITMYRLIVYGLGLLSFVAIIFSTMGTIDYDPLEMTISLVIILITGFVANKLLSRIWRIPANTESGLITCFILFLLLSPTLSPGRVLIFVVATIAAIASKYLLAYRAKHIFNPAAFGVFFVGVFELGHASWWVGSSTLWAFTLVLGLLVARKTRRLVMVAVFAVAAITTVIIMAANGDVELTESLDLLLFSSPLIFLGTIMMTEPSTMPPSPKQRYTFAILTGVLFAAHPKIGPLFIYPETALLIANIYAFAVSPKRRWVFKLKTKRRIADELYDYEFISEVPLQSIPGQYMEVTMPVSQVDDRGNRRTFTIASSPTESSVHIGVRIPANPSRFKQTLAKLKIGDSVLAGQVAGSFVLPSDKSKKLLLIAGGVGITPYRSMVKQISDTKDERDIVLLYLVKTREELMFQSVFDEAKPNGLQAIYLTDAAPLNASVLTQRVPDLNTRSVYISGPPPMVRHTKKLLRSLNVSRGLIKTDFFSGY